MIQVETNPEFDTESATLKGWHVLLMLLGFFGVMFVVNGVFLYHAITSFPGEDIKKSYVQGLNYNDTLAARASQVDLGWSAELGLRNSHLEFRLSDRAGAPLSGRIVIGELRRLATESGDRPLVFQAGTEGTYFADVSDLIPGQWQARITVYDQSGARVLFEAAKTLQVP